ncbi:MAG: hypothetical protein M1823_001772 [Watsoniomyces obsoletus]|nr:MAG: hypothetical protein M1823_001772 [Watsoniomyces obsoletus]
MHPLQSSAVVALLFGTMAWALPAAQQEDQASYGPQSIGDQGILQACVDHHSSPDSTADQLDEILQGCIINGDLSQSPESETLALVRRNLPGSYSDNYNRFSPAGASTGRNQLGSFSTLGQINRPSGGQNFRTGMGMGSSEAKPVMKIAQLQQGTRWKDPGNSAVLEKNKTDLNNCGFKLIQRLQHPSGLISKLTSEKNIQGRKANQRINPGMIDAAIRICVYDKGYDKKLSQRSVVGVRDELKQDLNIQGPYTDLIFGINRADYKYFNIQR